MNVLLVHPGTQYAGKLAAQLERVGLLARYWTGFAYPSESLLLTLAGRSPWPGLRRRLAHRALPGVPGQKIRCQPFGEISALLRKGIGLDEERVFHRRNERFQRAIPDSALRAASAVIGFDTSAWILARRCQAIGKPLILDQSIAHPLARERLYEDLAGRYPEWSESCRSRRPEVLAAENEEHRLAQSVVVASAFTKETLTQYGLDAAKIRVNPYGVDLAQFHIGKQVSRDRPLRFVFVGALQARKGIPVLLEAWRREGWRNAELWLVGPVAPQVRRLIPDLPGLRVQGPVPHANLPRLFSECDVFVFPSLFEGFGLVILEAMACGLPVITTEATAGPDVMTDGKEGFLIPSGDVDALEAKMRWCLENRERLPEMGRAARATAERFTWEAYGDRWKAILNEAVAEFGLRSSEIGNCGNPGKR